MRKSRNDVAIAPGLYATRSGKFSIKLKAAKAGRPSVFKTFETRDEAETALRELTGRVANGFVDLNAHETLEALILATTYYDKSTGLMRRVNTNTVRRQGRSAQAKGRGGYVMIGFAYRGKIYSRYVHRVAFLLENGEWPVGVVDHMNGDRSDNRWSNLRETTSAENNVNRAHCTKLRNVFRFNGRYYPIIGDGFETAEEAALVAETL